VGTAGRATDDLSALIDKIIGTITAPPATRRPACRHGHQFRPRSTISPLAIGRVVEGTLRKGEMIALCDEGAAAEPRCESAACTQLLGFEGIQRVEVDEPRRPATVRDWGIP